MTRKERLRKALENIIDDSVAGLLYYDRKEDESMSREDIEEMFRKGMVSTDEVVLWFSQSLLFGVSEWVTPTGGTDV